MAKRDNSNFDNNSAKKYNPEHKSGGFKKKTLQKDIKLSTDERLIVNPEQVRGGNPGYQPVNTNNKFSKQRPNYRQKNYPEAPVVPKVYKPEDSSSNQRTYKQNNSTSNQRTYKPENPTANTKNYKPENPTANAKNYKPENPTANAKNYKQDNPTANTKNYKPDNSTANEKNYKPENPSANTKNYKQDNPTANVENYKQVNPNSNLKNNKQNPNQISVSQDKPIIQNNNRDNESNIKPNNYSREDNRNPRNNQRYNKFKNKNYRHNNYKKQSADSEQAAGELNKEITENTTVEQASAKTAIVETVSIPEKIEAKAIEPTEKKEITVLPVLTIVNKKAKFKQSAKWQNRKSTLPKTDTVDDIVIIDNSKDEKVEKPLEIIVEQDSEPKKLEVVKEPLPIEKNQEEKPKQSKTKKGKKKTQAKTDEQIQLEIPLPEPIAKVETNESNTQIAETSNELKSIEPVITIVNTKSDKLPASKKKNQRNKKRYNRDEVQAAPIIEEVKAAESIETNQMPAAEQIQNQESIQTEISSDKTTQAKEVIKLPFAGKKKHQQNKTSENDKPVIETNQEPKEIIKLPFSSKKNKRIDLTPKIIDLAVEVISTDIPLPTQEISAENIDEQLIQSDAKIEKSIDEQNNRHKKNKHKNKNKSKYTNEKIELDAKTEDIDPILLDPNYIKTTFEVVPEPVKKQKKTVVDDQAYSKIPSKMLVDYDKAVNPVVTNLLKVFEDTLTEELFLVEGSRIMVAVSGGVDSISLLDMFAQIAEKYKLTLIVAHFNHNLRGISSDADEDLVRKVSEKYALKIYTNSENIMAFASSNSISIEQAARARRYKMFERLAGNLKINFVATAHSSDDNAETFLLNLLRGTGLTGLTGIPKKRILTKNSHLIRPLINIKKSDIYEYAKARKLKWREDESNSLTNYTRNKIRLDLLPKLQADFSQAIVDTINKTASILRGADDFINTYVNGLLQLLIKDRRKDRYMINIPQLQTFTEFIQSEIVQQSIVKVFKSLPVSSNVIERVLALCESPSGSVCDINKTAYVVKDRNYLVFSIKNSTFKVDMQIEKIGEYDLGTHILKLTEVPRKNIEFSKDPNIEYIAGELLPSFLQLRNWENGDVFQPLGMEGHVKVSDFLSNIKVPILEKPNVLVLTTKTEIVWVLGKRLSNKYKLNSTSKKVIKAEFISKIEKKK